MNAIETVEKQIEAVAKTIVDVKTVLDYPVERVPGQLPAMSIIYQGVSQTPATHMHTDNVWRFEMTIMLPVENLKKSWLRMKDLAPTVLETFRQNPGLNGSCYYSLITAGEAFINTAENNSHFGHTFNLEVHREEIT